MKLQIKLWLSLLGGALAWFVHLMACYAIGEGSCLLGGTAFEFWKITAAGWMLIGVSGVCIGLSLLAFKTASKYRKDPNDAHRFVGQVGMYSNVIFTWIILVQSLPILFYLNEC